MSNRILDRNDPGNKLYANGAIPIFHSDPHVDFDEESEIGEYFELKTFGGYVRDEPYYLRTIPILQRMESVLTKTNPEKYYYLTNVEVAKRLSEAYWSQPYPPGEQMFHPNVIFWNNSAPDRWFYPTNDDKIDPLAPRMQIDNAHKNDWVEGDVETVKCWNETQDIWKALRSPWEEAEFVKWASTPWGFQGISRYQLDRFQGAFDEQNVLMASECVRMLGIRENGDLMNWESQPDFMARLPTQASENGNFWVYFVIGLLMAAAMPIIPQDEEIWETYTYCLRPRRLTEARFGTDETTYPYETFSRFKRKSVFYRPFEGSRRSTTDPEQSDYATSSFTNLGCML
ncbi:hypothetical protein F5Y18DRAFT_326601 [Xylariaceae sp. FL1019]|nr:hypothetical protein F5Y18DRAFT_326601 [Xylariaceae sp. FL1019]